MNKEKSDYQYSRYPKFANYPKISYLEEFPEIWDHEGYFFEKIDGGQCQVRNSDSGLIGGSKTNFLFGGRTDCSWFPKFLKWMRKNKSLNNLPKNIILFGEWLEPTTIDYDKENLDKFYFIDLGYASDEETALLYDFNEAVNYLKNWKIEEVEILPPINYGEFNIKTISKLRKRKSYLRDGSKEGIILKDYKCNLFAKSLNPEYSEIREQEKTLEEKYVNRPRVVKALRRLKDERNIGNPTIDELVSEVTSDVLKESKVKFYEKAVKAVIRIRNLYHFK